MEQSTAPTNNSLTAGAEHTIDFIHNTARLRLQAGDDPGDVMIDAKMVLHQWITANIDGCICRDGELLSSLEG